MAEKAGGLMLEMSRVFHDRPSRLFSIFSDPDELSKWWGPEGFATLTLDFRPSTGRRYRIEMQPSEGEVFFLIGEFREVDPPRRLTYTFEWEDPDPDDVETIVDLSFRAVDDSTEVTLIQGPFKTEARRSLHRTGWTDGFNKIARMLSMDGKANS
jgi:uncharacterized protein YndB with AHSA1/START domain